MRNDLVKIGRNEPCPCGSGLKYKKCCMNKTSPKPVDMAKLYERKYGIRLKTQNDVECIRESGRLVLEALDLVERQVQPGVTTNDLDRIVNAYALKSHAVCAPLNYKGFPKNICTSINEVICHGIPSDRSLNEGDIINVDITLVYQGYYADANKTFIVGEASPDSQKIVSVAAQSLKAGMSMLKPGNTVGDIGWAIQNYAEGQKCSVVREFVGHGIGFEFHEAPQIPHYGRKGDGIVLVPGMVFTIEPMINLGKPELFIAGDNWTAVTRDRSLSAQFEQTFFITEDGYESLTPFEF